MTSTPMSGSALIGPSGTVNFSHTAFYTYLDAALKDRWQSFSALTAEMDSFVPKPLAAWDVHREAEVTRLHALNPNSTVESLAEFVAQQVAVAAAPSTQFHDAFDSRHMTEYVTVLMLAHALCEALVNAALAIGLAHVGSASLFGLMERAELKQKWMTGPKAVSSAYTFPEGTVIHETLIWLVKQRNALMHHKIELTVNGEKVLDGSAFKRQPYIDELRWIRRFFSLPYDLVDHIRGALPAVPIMLIHDAHPIQRFRPNDA